jgi:hypothetical protein
MTKLNGMITDSEHLSKNIIYKFKMILVQFNTVVVISTKKEMMQYDYITYILMSRFKFTETEINYMTPLEAEGNIILR